MPETAKFDLKRVKEIVQGYIDGNQNSIWFSSPSRSTKCIIAMYLCTEQEAIKKVTEGILALHDSDFSHRVYQWDLVADVYGLEDYLEHNWYVKFLIGEDDGEKILEEISFHPVQKTLSLQDGRLLLVTQREGN